MSDTLRTILIDGGPPLQLADENQTQFIYNLLPVGHFYDKRYGEVYITRDKLKQIEQNFGKVPSYEVPVKIGHEQGALSPGKVIAVRARRNGLEITMTVDAETAKAINNKQFRYMSAEFDDNYQDKKTGEFVGATLLGAALVNQPANPYMEPIVLVDDINLNQKKGEEILMHDELESVRKQLADTQAQLKVANETLEATNKKFADLEIQNQTLLAEKEKAEHDKLQADVKAFADKWTAAGVPPAVIELVKPVLLSKHSQVIKLSDNSNDDKNSLKFFDDLFGVLPKVKMTQVSTREKPEVELSDVQKNKEHAKLIAESLNK